MFLYWKRFSRHLVSHIAKKKKRTYRTYSEITDLATVIPAAHITSVSRSLPTMAPELGALVVAVF